MRAEIAMPAESSYSARAAASTPQPPNSEAVMNRPCPLCLAEGTAAPAFPYGTKFHGESFAYVKCEACGCTFVDPVPSDETFAAMYAVGSYHDVHYAESSVNQYAPSIDFLEASGISVNGRHILDFGCGAGMFMRAAQDRGAVVAGAEHSLAAATALAARTGMEVRVVDDYVNGSRRFDVIHLGDVLEHLPTPVDTFRLLERLLTPTGVFFVEGPLQANASLVYGIAAAVGSVRRRLGAFRLGTNAPTHLILATERSQRLFFESSLGYSIGRFDLTEDGWPYRNSVPGPRTLAQTAKRAVGTAAVFAARVPGLKNRIGNRFTAIAGPTTAPVQPNGRSQR